METIPSGQVFRFGPFELQLRSGELRKRGIRMSLQEQPLRILAALLERPGEVVSRDDLCRRLWPQGTFVDFEHSLNAAVRRLRTTLGDEAETPRFIETVHRRGYRFLAWGLTSPAASAAPANVGRPAAPSAIGATSPNAPALLLKKRLRLAVLPFVSLAPEVRHDLFSEGLTEELLTQITRSCPAHVGVIARTSVMRVVCAEQTAADTGRVLSADYLIEGSVRREGERVRIVAQLIEARDETHLWAATYDRVGINALSVQTDVAERIAVAVAAALNALLPPLSREAAS